MKHRMAMKRRDKMLLIGTHALMAVIDVIALWLIWSAVSDMFNALRGMARAEPVIRLPIRQAFVFGAIAFFLAHLILVTSNRFTRPRPRLTTILTVAFIALWLGGIVVGWGMQAWFAKKAVSAGYTPCSSFTKPYDMRRLYGVSDQACAAFRSRGGSLYRNPVTQE